MTHPPGNRGLARTGDSIFSRVTRLARRHDALNLGQGFPDYRPPEALVDRLRGAVKDGFRQHQYAPSPGRMDLREELAGVYRDLYGVDYDPAEEITVTAGATEALASALLGLLNPGDEVLLFEPVYDQYAPFARRAGADVTRLALGEDFRLPLDRLEERVNDDTRLIVLNNPHNPTGTVFRPSSLRRLVERAVRHDVWLLSDEVYEHHRYDGVDYVPLACLEGARERTLWVGSAGKSFDATGWKLGWLMAPSDLGRAVRRAHQFTTFCAAHPLQAALAVYLREEDPPEFFARLRGAYRTRRDVLTEGLEAAPFTFTPPEGTYFMTVEVPEEMWPEGENPGMRFVRRLVREVGVAAIPLGAFRGEDSAVRAERRLRLAFCKRREVLREAASRLAGLA